MELNDVMRTTFACREWTDEPVDDETIYRILEVARFAPSGGNRQGWHVTVVKSKQTRRKFVPLIKPFTSVYLAQVEAGENPWNTIHPTSVDVEAAKASGADFPGLEEMVEAPVVLVVSVNLEVVASFDKDLDRIGVISGASIYPFVWNILLAARNEGLAGVLATYLAGCEPQVQQLLGLPEHHAVAAMVPLGYPVKQLTKLSRLAVDQIATVDRFDGEPFSV